MATSKNALGRKPKQARSRKTVDQILLQAEYLIAARGIEALVMSHLAKASGVGQATLYNYFPTLESLCTAIAERLADRVEGLLSDLPDFDEDSVLEEVSNAYCTVLVKFYKAEPAAHRFFEALESGKVSSKLMSISLNKFIAHLSATLSRLNENAPQEDLSLIALGYFRIADAFLWQVPSSVRREEWIDFMMQTLANYVSHLVALKVRG